MVITGVAPLTGALSRELNNVPWRQSNYMHVLATTTANQAENDDASHQSFHHLRGKQGSCSASRSRLPDPSRHRASASPPPALCTTDFLSRHTRSSSDPDDPSRTSSCPHTATPLQPHPFPPVTSQLSASASPGSHDGRSKIRFHFSIMWSVS